MIVYTWETSIKVEMNCKPALPGEFSIGPDSKNQYAIPAYYARSGADAGFHGHRGHRAGPRNRG